MIFSNSRTINKSKNTKDMVFIVPYSKPPIRKVENPPSNTRIVERPNNNGKIKAWGPYIWYMLHGLAEK